MGSRTGSVFREKPGVGVFIGRAGKSGLSPAANAQVRAFREVGLWPIFLVDCRMADTSDNLINLFTPAIEGMGYELVGVEYLHKGGSGGGGLLRIYIDNPDGITLEDCSRVSHQVSGILDVEDPIRENYNLEVSSPGLDRPLFGRRDFQRFAGNRVTLKLRTKISGQRRFKGELQGIDDDDVLLAVDDEVFRLPLDQIDKARLVPEF